jgi:hypothetical protein
MRRVAGVVVCLVALVFAALASAHGDRAVRTYSTPSTPPLRTGLMDTDLFTSAQRPQALSVARRAGARYIRLIINWAHIAPSSPPAGFNASDPDSPGYDWTSLDNLVTSAASAGLTPILDIATPPSWALSSRPKAPNAGRPKIAAVGQFARALALHYDGSHGAPAEHVFQVWNEPNLSLDLSPVNAAV